MPETSATFTGPISFWKRGSVRRFVGGLVALWLVICYGVVGYVLLGWSLLDSLYMVEITVSGVGFEEVHPLTSTIERVHTMLVIAFGVVAMAFTVAGFVQIVAEGEIQQLLGHQRVRRQIEVLKDHVVVAGFGRMGSLVCDELAEAGEPFVVIDHSGDRVPDIERRGYLYVVGDATEEKVLLESGLRKAKALVTAVPSDADNVFITLTARELAPDVQIVSRAEHPTTQKKLHQAGANHVVLPASIGARRIVTLLTNPSAVQFAELVTQRAHLALEMDEFAIAGDSHLIGHSLRDLDIGRRTGVIVIAVKRFDGRVEFPPSGDQRFSAGDSIVLVGRRSNLDEFRLQFCSPAKDGPEAVADLRDGSP
jgi:voltage-gated potassium channel